ncbi:hypothetical protein GCM10010401_16200 [Rarobacter faecitabidus]|uniref:Putative alpha-1,2-mannosidase n=1 Tax=Rarobacter faecitabidus TaxID=13243 RepID=A0A542ZXA3_RARFA|nr:glycoside hydrolase domain-containing protein [Rarobacter faecitabidus]TQL64978.1 putative alpha-1,2-mannosidase [Rarobacter faecitabidus]
MKRRTLTAALMASVLTLTSGAAVPQAAVAADTPDAVVVTTDPTTFVDPFMGTQHDFGQMIPGAFAPSGIVKSTPVTYPKRAHGGYDYAQSQISGFVHTNTDGAGGNGAGGDFLVVPTAVTYTQRPSVASYVKSFSHANESASPGYYQVGLASTQGTDSQVLAGTGIINAELAALQRTGVDRYTFPQAGRASLVLDLNNNFDRRVLSRLDIATLADGRAELTGELVGVHGGTYRLYFYAQTSRPVARVQTWGDTGALTESRSQQGWDNGAVLGFDLPSANSSVSLAVTFSGISIEQAQRDQRSELGAIGAAGASAANPLNGTALDTVRQATHDTWAALLGRVRVTASDTSDPTGELRGIFYTSLYRMHGAPVDVTSTDGTYLGGDGVVYPDDGRAHYDSWSTWDDFRKYAVFSLLYPELYADMVRSMVDMFAQANYAGVASPRSLIHSVPGVRWERTAVVVADALAKGFPLERLDEAYPSLAAFSSAYPSIDSSAQYLADRAGVTVEAAYDDWAMSSIAEEIGKTDDAVRYRQRALNYQNLIKPSAWTSATGTQVGVLTPRNGAGAWASPDLEKFEGDNPYQGSLWQYHWYPTHDLQGLFTSMGGTTAARSALSHFFGEEAPANCARMLHSNANEVDLHTPYLFNYLGEPSKTQKWVREIYTAETCNRYVATTENIAGSHNKGEFLTPRKMRVYKLSPDGLLPTMDDDHGTMSAMFVAAAVGLFPVTQGSDQFQIGTPFFEKVSIAHADGTEFSVNADGVSPTSYYVQSARLNGAALANTWVTYGAIAGQGSLAFTMGATATPWGAGSAPAYSMSDPSTSISTTSRQPAAATGSDTTAQVRSRLTRRLTESQPAVRGSYTVASFSLFDRARDAAAAGLAASATSRARLLQLDARLASAAAGLVPDSGILRRLEAEASSAWSGGSLARETNASSGNLGGVAPGAWITYPITGTDVTPAGIQVRYANPSGSGFHDASVEIRAGTQDGSLVGTVALPPTGVAWSDYRVASAQLTNPAALAGAASVTFVFRGATPAGRSWVSNVDWLQFTSSLVVARTPLTAGNTSSAGVASDGAALNLTSDPYKIQNIKDGSWIRYGASSAAGRSAIGADRLLVQFEKPTGRAPENSWIEVHRGARDSVDYDRVQLPFTASGWGTMGTVQIDLDPARYSDAQDIYVVFRSTGHNSDRPYVGNVVSLRFDAAPSSVNLATAYQQAVATIASATPRLPAYLSVLQREMAAANHLIAVTEMTGETLGQGEVDEAALRLRRAIEQVVSMEWVDPGPGPGENPPGGNPGGGSPVPSPGAAPGAVTTLAAIAGTSRYGEAHRVTVSVSARTKPAGVVTVSEGARKLGTARVANGSAVVPLPKNLTVGTHALTVAFAPQATAWSASSTRTTLRVTKARPRVVSVRAKRLRVGQRAEVVVHVRGVAPYTPKGTRVRLVVGGRTIGRAKVVKSKTTWVAVIKTKKLRRTGSVTVRFYGKSSLATSTVKTSLRVERAAR